MNKGNLFLLGLLLSGIAFADVSVKGYYRKDGTYVAPHHRSSPDGDTSNNYSSAKNNTNSQKNDKDTDKQKSNDEAQSY